MSANILFQLQLSSYDVNGIFNMIADSNWQVFVSKAINMIKVDSNIHFDVIVPEHHQCKENLYDILRLHNLHKNVSLIELRIAPNALKTRYDFDYSRYEAKLATRIKHYTHIYVNDPMLTRHFRAMTYLYKCNPIIITQCHFLDTPENRLVDESVSYWEGTVEGMLKSDYCVWHSTSQMHDFFVSLEEDYKSRIINNIKKKSIVWKSGYSIEEIRMPINYDNIRFDTKQFDNKTVVWVPNRVGGLNRSFDYTNNGKFLFEIVPELWKKRQDFVIVAGNPSQKIGNYEISQKCPACAYFDFGALNRDEYRWLSQRANIVVALYTIDQNGGCGCLESIEFGATPLFPDVYEYQYYFDNVSWPQELRIKPNLQNTDQVLSKLIDIYKTQTSQTKVEELRQFIQHYAAYEYITEPIMKQLKFA